MNYLARLKQLDQQNNSLLSPESVLTKLPKAPSVSCGSIGQGASVKLHAADTTRYANADNGPITLTPADARIEKVVDKLHCDLHLRFAAEAHDDIDPDAVILTVAIRDKGACEFRIPKSRYDAFALLELIDRHTTRETLQ
jgi:hypothetical protein